MYYIHVLYMQGTHQCRNECMYKKFNNIITQFTNPFLESGFNMVELTFQHQHWPVSGTIQHARMKMHYNKVPPSPTPLKCA